MPLDLANDTHVGCNIMVRNYRYFKQFSKLSHKQTKLSKISMLKRAGTFPKFLVKRFKFR